jgi:SnoaL-like domain
MKENFAINQGSLNIENVQSHVIYDYFTRLNANDFEGFAALFSPDGVLHPPFETAIVGRVAICQYLQSTGIEVKALPQSGTMQPGKDGLTVYQISGKVQTPYFTVDVVWTIDLNAEQQVTSVQIKLLATLQDLLRFKRS